jgi:hypothetical protein
VILNYDADVTPGVMMVKVTYAPKTSSKLPQFVILGGLAVGLLHEPKDPLHPLWIRGVGRGWGGIELTAHCLAIVGRSARVLFIAGTLSVDVLENPIRIGPETHHVSPWSVFFPTGKG